MAGSWTSEKFPQFEQAVRALTEQHRELEDEPLHLAISYGPLRDQQDIFLFEKRGIGVGGRVLGRFYATGIRPKFAEKLRASGVTVPAALFDHSLEI